MEFADASFDTAVCFTMLHHVPSRELQDRLLAEGYRVLKPGGWFYGSDSTTSFRFRLFHVFDTCVPVEPEGSRRGWRRRGSGRFRSRGGRSTTPSSSARASPELRENRPQRSVEDERISPHLGGSSFQPFPVSSQMPRGESGAKNPSLTSKRRAKFAFLCHLWPPVGSSSTSCGVNDRCMTPSMPWRASPAGARPPSSRNFSTMGVM